MILGRVVGRSWSEVMDPVYRGRTVFHIQPLAQDLSPQGATFLAVDTVGAGPGEVVLVAREGNAARQVIAPDTPVHSVVLGIVDEVDEAPR